MYPLRIACILTFILLVTDVFAQDNYKEVDLTSYNLYMSEKWKELSEYGAKASEKGFDYYYLNVRTGRAFFELKDYETSKKYFEKAITNNSASTFAQEYLFWNYLHLKQEGKAIMTYKSLPDSIKERINYDPIRPIDYVFVEGGMKMSGNKDVADNMTYGSFGMNHKISPFFDVYHGYTYLQQKAAWGEMKQHQYLIIPGINLPHNWRITTALNYTNYASTLDYNDNFSYENGGFYISDSGRYNTDSVISKNYLFKGSYQQNALFGQLNISKQIGGWLFTPHIGVYQAWEDPNYQTVISSVNEITEKAPPIPMFPPPPFTEYTTTDTTITNYKTADVYQQWQYGLDLSYTINGKVSLGADINYIYYNNSSKLNIVPYTRIQFSENVSLFAYYTRKENYVLSLFQGTQFLNSLDEIKNKISITGEFKLSSKFGLFTTYQYESITDNLSLKEYQFNSLFIGLKFRP